MAYIDAHPRLKFSCIYASLEDLETQLLETNKRALERGDVSIRRAPLERQRPAFGPPMHSHHRQGIFFVPTTWSEGCILKSNVSDGWYTLVLQLSSRLACKTIHWELSFGNGSMDSFVNAFYLNISGDKPRRAVRCLQEGSGRWDYFAAGDVQPFECADYYSRRQLKDRINREILIEYLLTLGMNVRDDAFWSTMAPTVIFETLQKQSH